MLYLFFYPIFAVNRCNCFMRILLQENMLLLGRSIGCTPCITDTGFLEYGFEEDAAVQILTAAHIAIMVVVILSLLCSASGAAAGAGGVCCSSIPASSV